MGCIRNKELEITSEEARKIADTHLSINEKLHSDHKVAIIPCEVITRKIR